MTLKSVIRIGVGRFRDDRRHLISIMPSLIVQFAMKIRNEIILALAFGKVFRTWERFSRVGRRRRTYRRIEERLRSLA